MKILGSSLITEAKLKKKINVPPTLPCIMLYAIQTDSNIGSNQYTIPWKLLTVLYRLKTKDTLYTKFTHIYIHFSYTWGRNWQRLPTWIFKAATCSSTTFWVVDFLLMNQKDWFFVTSISRVITRFPDVLNLIKRLF